MSPHRFDPDAAERLEDPDRFRYLSRDELLDALSLDEDASVVDLGSGTGFYTREVAPFVGRVYAVDLQWAMHEAFEVGGVPTNVSLLWAKAASLPIKTDSLDGAYSTMTYHEYGPGAMEEVYRVLVSGGRLVVVDWSAAGTGERGPPPSVRSYPSEVAETLESVGFDVDDVESRPETLLVTATTP